PDTSPLAARQVIPNRTRHERHVIRKKTRHRPDPARPDGAVGVGDEDPFAACCGDATGQSGLLMSSRTGRVERNQADRMRRMTLLHGLNLRGGGILRMVVHHDDLEAVGGVVVGEHRCHTRRDGGGFVAGGDDDGDERKRSGRRLALGGAHHLAKAAGQRAHKHGVKNREHQQDDSSFHQRWAGASEETGREPSRSLRRNAPGRPSRAGRTTWTLNINKEALSALAAAKPKAPRKNTAAPSRMPRSSNVMGGSRNLTTYVRAMPRYAAAAACSGPNARSSTTN